MWGRTTIMLALQELYASSASPVLSFPFAVLGDCVRGGIVLSTRPLEATPPREGYGGLANSVNLLGSRPSLALGCQKGE